MKVKVSVNVASNLKSHMDKEVGPGQTVELQVKENDSVQTFKSKIMESQMIGFREQDLKFNGKILPEMDSLADCGVADGALVELAVRSSEAGFVSALHKLLQERDLSLEELAMLYCYKHGVSINQVLQSLGIEERFANFVSRHSMFTCKGGRVSVCRSRAPPGLTMPEKVVKQPEVQHQNQSSNQVVAGEGATGDQYLELHTKISGRAFSSKATQALNDITTMLTEKLFLNIDHVVRGGSVGRGTVIGNVTDAELVFFLKDLPVVGQTRWLPPLHKAVVGVLSEQLSASHGVEDVRANAHSVKLTVRGVVSVDLKFVPVLGSISEVYQSLGLLDTETRKWLAAGLVKERTHFIAKQPGQVKVTMRLLKWWRDQQEWSSPSARPSDDLLELLTVYSAIQSKPQDQQAAVTNVLSLMSRFDELTVTWSNFYKKTDIWEPLLNQRPLVMDPVNPFHNVADPQVFDFRELMVHASQTRFFW